MTFLTLQTELANKLHLDVTNDATRIKRRINMAVDDISGSARWQWLQTVGRFQTTADYTTGTADVTLGSGTVTGTSTVWTAAMVGLGFRIDGTKDWYTITARASNTSITISPVYAGATATTNVYTIRQFYYSLAADADVIYDMRQWQTPRRLVEVSPRELDEFTPQYDVAAAPRAYVQWPRTAAGLLQVQLYPTPSSIMNMEYRYYRTLAPAALSAEGDIPEIPAKYHPIIVEKAALYYLTELGDEAAIARQKTLVDDGLQKMLANNQQTTDRIPVLSGGWWARGASRFIPFPPTFQQPG